MVCLILCINRAIAANSVLAACMGSGRAGLMYHITAEATDGGNVSHDVD